MVTNNLSPTEREFLIQLRSLLLKAVDLIERRAALGRYRSGRTVEIQPGDSVAYAGTDATPTVVIKTEYNMD